MLEPGVAVTIRLFVTPQRLAEGVEPTKTRFNDSMLWTTFNDSSRKKVRRHHL